MQKKTWNSQNIFKKNYNIFGILGIEKKVFKVLI